MTIHLQNLLFAITYNLLPGEVGTSAECDQKAQSLRKEAKPFVFRDCNMLHGLTGQETPRGVLGRGFQNRVL
jgi:hypothetical protein